MVFCNEVQQLAVDVSPYRDGYCAWNTNNGVASCLVGKIKLKQPKETKEPHKTKTNIDHRIINGTHTCRITWHMGYIVQ